MLVLNAIPASPSMAVSRVATTRPVISSAALLWAPRARLGASASSSSMKITAGAAALAAAKTPCILHGFLCQLALTALNYYGVKDIVFCTTTFYD